ncbi:MAG: 16S rRNA methyltransferase, partial [Clostridia bacterium]|nr:16S rRNA methyltransferase [Clostridia bacterium]
SEVAQLVKAGAQSVSLGKRILRTETAGLAMLAQTLYEVET